MLGIVYEAVTGLVFKGNLVPKFYCASNESVPTNKSSLVSHDISNVFYKHLRKIT
jgi:hypothetical protein